MEEFLDTFSLFDMALVALVPMIVQGIKAVYRWWYSVEMPPRVAVGTVFVVSWVLLAMHALVAYAPGSDQYVKYALAAVLLPLTAAGVYGTAKAMAGK